MKISVIKGARKPFKIKTVIFQKIGRVILWTLIIFLFLRGVGTLFVNSETGEAQRLINQFIEDKGYKERVELEATAFAEGFAMEYFTYERGGDYEERLLKYLPSSISIGNPGYGKIKALSARGYGLEWYSNTQINVSVAVRVLYDIQTQENNETRTQQREEEIFIMVPVMELEGKYIVEDHPGILPAPSKAEVSTAFFSGAGPDAATVNEVKEVLESFFKTYYSGTPGEISYYMYENKRIKGLEKRYSFNRLDSVRVFDTGTQEDYLVISELTISDSISGISYKQGYHIQLTKVNNRYYIKEFNVRTVNIKNGSVK